MSGFLEKTPLDNAYEQGITTLQLGLYAVFVSVLKDELGDLYPIGELKGAAANTINRMCIRPDLRPDPLARQDKLSASLAKLAETTLVKEAVTLILLYDYYLGGKKDEMRLRKARNLSGPSIADIERRVDPQEEHASYILDLATALAGGLSSIAHFDLRDYMEQ